MLCVWKGRKMIMGKRKKIGVRISLVDLTLKLIPPLPRFGLGVVEPPPCWRALNINCGTPSSGTSPMGGARVPI